MLEKTSTPSLGHPVPAIGSHSGEEYGRMPTRVIGVSAVGVIVQAAGAFAMGHGTFAPPGVGPGIYGMWNVRPFGRTKEYAVSPKKGPQPRLESFKSTDSCCKSRQVCGLLG